MTKSWLVDGFQSCSKKSKMILIIATYEVLLIAYALLAIVPGGQQDSWIFDAPATKDDPMAFDVRLFPMAIADAYAGGV